MNVKDAIIIGAGPAGLSAALILGRCCRNVLVFDTGRYRNAASTNMHGFLSRDGTAPLEFLEISREQLNRYCTIELRNAEVIAVNRRGPHFEVLLADNSIVFCRKLLIATGVVDIMPAIADIESFYGRSVFHCPYCDGWEFKDEPIAIYGTGEHGKGLALELTAWSRNLTLLTDGSDELTMHDIERLESHFIKIRHERIIGLEGHGGMLQCVAFETGAKVFCSAMFFSTGQHQRSLLAQQIGCDFTDKGAVATGKYESTNVPGLYVAGDASRAVQLVIVAAAEGAEAAFAINTALLREDLVVRSSSEDGSGR
jgi:thioredoxin reductase